MSPRRRRLRLSTVLLVLAGVALLAWGASQLSQPGGNPGVRASLSAVAAIAGDDTTGFARAVEPRAFAFPEDHGPHPEYRTEWWYLTGNLVDQEGRPFGYQLTFFRSSLTPEPPQGESQWSTNQLWMAHFAVTDVAGGRHRAFERFARGAAGLAGAESEPVRVWLDDWRGEGPQEGGFFPFHLQAGEDGWALDLILGEGKAPVFQGEAGLSQKGPEEGNASYYFSYTRMPSEGWVEVDGVRFRVTGNSWMDREWSTSALGDDHVGWDWFSLQLDDERELMFFELRRRDGSRDPLNHGVLVEADGSYRALGSDEVELEVLGNWTSPLDGARYPSGWNIRVPREGLELRVTPRVQDQEMNLAVRYWEGSVQVEGMGPNGRVTGVGFVELTGYGER